MGKSKKVGTELAPATAVAAPALPGVPEPASAAPATGTVATVVITGTKAGTYTAAVGSKLSEIAEIGDLTGFVIRGPKGHLFSKDGVLPEGILTLSVTPKAKGG